MEVAARPPDHERPLELSCRSVAGDRGYAPQPRRSGRTSSNPATGRPAQGLHSPGPTRQRPRDLVPTSGADRERRDVPSERPDGGASHPAPRNAGARGEQEKSPLDCRAHQRPDADRSEGGDRPLARERPRARDQRRRLGCASEGGVDVGLRKREQLRLLESDLPDAEVNCALISASGPRRTRRPGTLLKATTLWAWSSPPRVHSKGLVQAGRAGAQGEPRLSGGARRTASTPRPGKTSE